MRANEPVHKDVNGIWCVTRMDDVRDVERRPRESELEVTAQVVDGEHAHIVWHGESEKYRLPFGTDTFVLKGGKIVFRRRVDYDDVTAVVLWRRFLEDPQTLLSVVYSDDD